MLCKTGNKAVWSLPSKRLAVKGGNDSIRVLVVMLSCPQEAGEGPSSGNTLSPDLFRGHTHPSRLHQEARATGTAG